MISILIAAGIFLMAVAVAFYNESKSSKQTR
jgi:hypothetical protein